MGLPFSDKADALSHKTCLATGRRAASYSMQNEIKKNAAARVDGTEHLASAPWLSSTGVTLGVVLSAVTGSGFNIGINTFGDD